MELQSFLGEPTTFLFSLYSSLDEQKRSQLLLTIKQVALWCILVCVVVKKTKLLRPIKQSFSICRFTILTIVFLNHLAYFTDGSITSTLASFCLYIDCVIWVMFDKFARWYRNIHRNKCRSRNFFAINR